MRLVSIDNIKPGVCLARNIYDGSGRVLLCQGAALTSHYISRLRQMGICSIYIDDGTAVLHVEDIVSEKARIEVIKITKKALLKVKAGNTVEVKEVRQAISDLIDEIIANRAMMVHLSDIRSFNDPVFAHSVNVCILSLLTGLAMGFDQLKLKELGTGALLHDIGKTLLPEKLLNKRIPYTPEEQNLLQKHTDYGFEILRSSENISSLAAHVAWQHHEKFNGNGYPRGLSGKDILEFARIVAVADTYDDMSIDLPYRKRRLPHEVIDYIRAAQGRDFDPEIASLFIRNIAPYPIGSVVQLNTGAKGIVMEVKKAFPTRPTVQLLYDEKGRRIEGCEVVDLMQELTLFVETVIRE